MNTTFSKWMAGSCRWTARILGALLITMMVIIAVGEGMPNPFTQPALVQFGFFALALILIGLLAGWRWEVAGAVLSLVGWGLFSVVVVKTRGMTSFVLVMALPGLLYLASMAMRRHVQ